MDTNSLSENLSQEESNIFSENLSQEESNIFSESGNNNKKINILKEDTILTQDQYNQEKINREYNELYMKSTQTTNEEIKDKENKRIYNLSIKEIINRASDVYINIINEITVVIKNKNLDIKKIINIITLRDRLIYVGILIVILSLFLAFIFISD